MSQLSLNLVAIAIFLMTMTSLLSPLVHLSAAWPAIATFSLLGIATLDTFSFQGQGSNLLLDWLAGFSVEHRQRVARHEAGHFLVAQLMDIPVTGYALTAWTAMRQGHPGYGGVRFDSQELDAELAQGTLSGQLLDRYCTIWMAGIAAEAIAYDTVAGGGDDRQKLRGVLTQLNLPPQAAQLKERLAIIRAKDLLKTHGEALEALTTALSQRSSVAECQAMIATYRQLDGPILETIK
jgi:hypothetical protein